MDIGYARVSTAKQDLERQLHSLGNLGIDPERIYIDKKSGATRDRPGLMAALAYARSGDVLVVYTLDRLGRTVRDTLNLVHELREPGIGLRTLADPFRINTADPGDPMNDLALLLREKGAAIAEICTKTGMSRSTLYRHLPPREPTDVTASTISGSALGISGSRFGGAPPKA